jgi:hypothetical protein
MDLIAELKAASRASTLKREKKRNGDNDVKKEEVRGNKIFISKTSAPVPPKKPNNSNAKATEKVTLALWRELI